MDDLISRQAAIEALHTWFRNGFDEDRWWNSTHVLAAIEGLPPAQPEPIKINIEDFNKEDWERFRKEWANTPITVLSAQPDTYWKEQCKSYEQTINKLKESLSTQPEIIRCKDYKYNATSKKCLNPNSFFLVPTDDDFCSYAEKREVAT